MEAERFQYYAFISYSHADEKWAKWLQKKLENYQLPSIIRKESGGRIPKYVRPVFRDRTDLGVGVLQQSLHQELEDSRYLIVVCSPNSARSDWVNKEIKHFQELGRGNRIIPFIVEGSPDADNEDRQCYPRALREAENEILGASLDALKPEEALVKIVAAILGLKYDQLYGRHKRRERQKKIMTASFIGVFFILLSIGAYFYWDYNRVKVHYYKNYTEKRGVPEGLFEIGSQQIKSRSGHYRFEYRQGKLRRVVHANSAGTPIRGGNTEYEDYASIQVLFYKTDSAVLDRIDYIDRNGRVLVRKNYSGDDLSVVDFTQDDKYNTAITLPGKAVSESIGLPGVGSGSGQKSDIARYLLELDDFGRTVRIRFMRDNRNTPVKDADGVFGMLIKRDELGRENEVIYTDEEGRPWPTHLGIMGKRYFYNNSGKLYRMEYFDKWGKPAYNSEKDFAVLEQEFDQNDNITTWKYLDPEGNPCLSKSEGIAGAKSEYNEQGFLVRTNYFGKDGKTCYSSEGLAGWTIEYDGFGNQIKDTTIGPDGTPCKNKSGYATRIFQYDEQGNVLAEKYFDRDGRPCLFSEGYAELRCKYDKRGNLTLVEYYGIDGKPCLDTVNGSACVRNEYDDKGRIIHKIFLGIDGGPAINKEWYAEIRYRYDERGNAKEIWYLDADDKLCFNKNEQVAGFIREYDAYGNMTRSIKMGPDGKQCTGKNWSSEMRREYDERGNLAVIRYYGMDGQLCLNNEGYALIHYKYDAKGNEIEEAYFGKGGESVLCTALFATARFKYDEYGNRTEASYWDNKGKPALISKGYSKYQSRYDEKGNEVERTYFGISGNLVIISDGYASLRWSYDDRNNPVERSCLGIHGEPVLNNEGYYKSVMVWNEYGKKTKQIHYGIDGNPCLTYWNYNTVMLDYGGRGNLTSQKYSGLDGKPCFSTTELGAGITYKYNDRDQIIECTYIGLDGKPYMFKDGYAILKYDVDQIGNIIQTSAFDNNGIPCATWFGYSIKKQKYDQRGNAIEERYCDTSGKPCLNSDGVAGIVFQYDDRDREISRFYTGIDGRYTVYNSEFSGVSGFSGFKRKFDEYGRCIEESYYDVNGKLSNSSIGCAVSKYTYDQRGSILEAKYFGDDDKPCMNTKEGFSSFRRTLNEHGKIVLIEYFDTDGSPRRSRHAAKEYKYDEGGEEVGIVYLDREGRTVPEAYLIAVGEVHAGSQASKSGLKTGDVIVEFAGWSFFSGQPYEKVLNEFVQTYSENKDKDKLFKIIRNDKVVEYQLPPGSIGINIARFKTSQMEVEHIRKVYEDDKR